MPVPILTNQDFLFKNKKSSKISVINNNFTKFSVQTINNIKLQHVALLTQSLNKVAIIGTCFLIVWWYTL